MADTAPERVVSINICAGQLALDLAAPGQIISVTHMLKRQSAPAFKAKAATIPGNTARVEEVYLLRPDLVLAGTFTAPATVRMLEGLGIRVEKFPPANRLEDIPRQIRQMGKVLGQTERAEAQARAFESEIARLSAEPARRPRIALIHVNSFASGTGTLEHDILEAAGFRNVAAEAGVTSIRRVPLEQLVMLAPEVIITGQDFEGAAKAEDTLSHPALKALRGTLFAGAMTTADWTCGTPRVLEAVRDMVVLRNRVLAQ